MQASPGGRRAPIFWPPAPPLLYLPPAHSTRYSLRKRSVPASGPEEPARSPPCPCRWRPLPRPAGGRHKAAGPGGPPQGPPARGCARGSGRRRPRVRLPGAFLSRLSSRGLFRRAHFHNLPVGKREDGAGRASIRHATERRGLGAGAITAGQGSRASESDAGSERAGYSRAIREWSAGGMFGWDPSPACAWLSACTKRYGRPLAAESPAQPGGTGSAAAPWQRPPCTG